MIKKNITKFTSWIDGLNLNFLNLFLILIFIINIRVFFDWYLLDYYYGNSYLEILIKFTLENTFYFLILFGLSAIIISLITGINLRKIMNFGAVVYPVIIIPPIIDHFIFGQVEGYHYATLQNVYLNLYTFFSVSGDAPPGIIIEIGLGLLGVFAWVVYKTKSILKGLISIVMINIVLVALSTPDLYFGEGLGNYMTEHFLLLYYFIPFLLLFITTSLIINPKRICGILLDLRIGKGVVLSVAALFGYAFLTKINLRFEYIDILASGSLAFLGWIIGVLINDIYDIDIDRVSHKNRMLVMKKATIDDYLLTISILSFVYLCVSSQYSLSVFLITLSIIGLGIAYSVPPLRLRNTLFGNIILGLLVMGSFMIGHLINPNSPDVSSDMIKLIVLLFALGAILPASKDIEDIEGCKKQGIKNIFTLFGHSKGKTIMFSLILFTLLAPFVLYLNPYNILIAFVAAATYHKYENSTLLYYISIIAMLINYQSFFIT